MSKFYWGDLIDSLAQRTLGTVQPKFLVPVIGSDLPIFADGRTAAQRLAAAVRAILLREVCDLDEPPHVAEDAPLTSLYRIARQHRCDFPTILREAHDAVLREAATAAPSQPVEILRELLPQFRFVLTTATDGLLPQALGIPTEETRATTLEQSIDLPIGWRPGDSPRLFHVFGHIGLTSDSAIVDEERLEFLSHLHGDGRPARLLDHLRNSHLLFLGRPFPQHFELSFLRLVRGRRLSLEGKPVVEAMPRSDLESTAHVVSFLNEFSPRTRLYRGGDSMQFLADLLTQWRSEQAQAAPATPVQSAPTTAGGVPGIFISYAGEDRPAATALADALEAKRLPVWFDRKNLRAGDPFKRDIEREIRTCRLFIPILSRHTESRREGFFRWEWGKAKERLEFIGPGTPLIVPIFIDDLAPYACQDLETYFAHLGQIPHVLRCPGGAAAPADLAAIDDRFKAAIRADLPA